MSFENYTITKALGLIETRGWVKGKYFSSSSGYCLLGAIREVLYGSAFGPDRVEDHWKEERVARSLGFATSGDLVVWNDDASTTETDVLELLRGGVDG